ncbi:MAG TPA: shikimate dehydrogenase [Vicinamibacterales bacterium]|nr:shikimate dehydrogenase [Vicinamibacterales bacterium]
MTTTPPLLCVTVTAPSTSELRRQRDLATDADIVELRLDSVRDPDVAGALEGRRLPVIVTCRASWEGGGFGGSEEERRRLLQQALELGAEYVDVEWRARFDDLVATHGSRVVLSSHDFDGVPADLAGQSRAMRATGAGVVKMAVKAGRLSDCLALLELSRTLGAHERSVLIAMGDAGLPTRVLAQRFGSTWTYAGGVREVGQLGARQLLEQFRYRSITPATDIYGLVGLPVAHSASPAMHNAAFAAAGIDAVYLPLPAADAADFVAFARGFGMKGASVTIPYKVSLFDCVEEADPLARAIGALNTLKMDGERWSARNTDVAGFLQPLHENTVPLAGRRASILGAGGSARAVAVALASEGAHVTIHARDTARAADVARQADGAVGAFPPRPDSWDLLVNCTPVGMYPRVEQSPMPIPALARGVVYDLIYNPPVTRLMREAAAAGCEVLGGLDMLVGQAQSQFEWWTGTRPPAGVMRAAAMKRLSEFTPDENHLV